MHPRRPCSTHWTVRTSGVTLLSRCDLGAAHVAMRYRTTNLSQIRIRRTKPTRATSPRRRADVTRPAPTGTPPSRTWNYDRLPPRVRNRWSPSMDGLVVLSPPTSPATGHGRTSPTCRSPIWSRCRTRWCGGGRRRASPSGPWPGSSVTWALSQLLMSSVTLGWDLMPSGPGVAWLYATSRCP